MDVSAFRPTPPRAASAGPATTGSATTGPGARAPKTKEEAAEAFQAVLVRQFVSVMTAPLFKASLAEGAPMAGGQADLQRDTLTDALTDHLVAHDALGLRATVLRTWKATPPTP